MDRLSDGSVVLSPAEARTVRAALFGIDRFVQTDLDANELRFVTGCTQDEMRAMRSRLDAVRVPEGEEDTREALRFHLTQLNAMTDLELEQPRHRRRLQGVIAESLLAGVDVPQRLRDTVADAAD